mmetsp:Transcript_26418/g.51911  ORF Transcript_26418/g.51911 Transcript_26418/m.51911 type:complete len:328 (+) Transcript_26418:1223-2206(+)
MVDSSLVGEEVLVDSEGGGDGSVVDELLLDLAHRPDGVGLGGSALVGLELGAEFLLGAGGPAGGGRSGLSARRELGLGVVRAHGKLVGPAGLSLACVIVVPSSHYTLLHEPSPGEGRLAPIAPEGEAGETVAARRGVLDREQSRELSFRRDAHTVVESLRRRERPAATALGLVTDVSDHGAFGPLFARIEVLGKVGSHQKLRALLLLQRQTVGSFTDNCAHERFRSLDRPLVKSGGTFGLPADVSRVHRLHRRRENRGARFLEDILARSLHGIVVKRCTKKRLLLHRLVHGPSVVLVEPSQLISREIVAVLLVLLGETLVMLCCQGI